MEERSEQALVAMRRILRTTELNARSLTRQSGLTPSQIIVLDLLKGMTEATAGDIARAARISHATVTALVDKLAARGLVLRRRGENDRRQVWVEITDAGREALAGAPDLLHNVFRARFNQLEGWEQAFIIAALERVVHLLNAGEMDAAPVLDTAGLTDAHNVPDAEDRPNR